MIKVLKRLFCRHSWKCIEETIKSTTFECTKCGKRKIYWN